MKKWLSFLCCLLVLFSLVTAVSATDPESPKVVDNADLFSPEELAELTRRAYDVSHTYGMDVVILTVPELEGYSSVGYADEFYNRNGYDEDCILFLLTMAERQWYMRTYGEATQVFTSRQLDRLEDAAIPCFSDGEYYEGFSDWLDALSYCFEAYQASGSEGQGNSAISILLSVGIGLAAAGITVGIMASQMRTAKAQSGAMEYMREGSYHLTVHRDLFLYSNIRKTPKPKDNGGSHGGGSRGGRGGSF